MKILQTLKTLLTFGLSLAFFGFSCQYAASGTMPSIVRRSLVDTGIADPSLDIDTASTPELNRRILRYVEANGSTIAPTYQSAVCTQFLVKVLENFTPLTKAERKSINIVTSESLESLREKSSPVLQGVYHALIESGKGVAIPLNEAQPGDLIQFWYSWGGSYRGHCGIIRSVDANWGIMQLYSSSLSGDGYGIRNYWIPDEVYVVRLVEHSKVKV